MKKTVYPSISTARIRGIAALTLGLFSAFLLPCAAQAQELILNGGFETGDFTGWEVRDFPGSASPGSFFLGNNTLDHTLTPATPSTPLNAFPSVGASQGNFYAVSDSSGPGAHALIQNFTLAPHPTNAVLSFDMFLNDWNGAGALNADGNLNPFQADGAGNTIPTQFATVDLLSGTASDFTDDVGLLNNFYLGENGFSATALPNGYEHFQYDITSLVSAGGTYRLRFGEVDNQFTLNQGIDNVSVFVTPSAVANTPEPGIAALAFGMTTGALSLIRKRKRRRGAQRISLLRSSASFPALCQPGSASIGR